MANEKRVSEIMKQFQNMNSDINSTQVDDDLAFLKGTPLEGYGLKGVKKNISPTLLKSHPKNTFSMVHDSEYETLKKAISEYGITNPVLCYPEDDYYIIISGHRRTSCAKELGLNKIPVNIIEKPENEIDILTLLGIENMSTRVPSPIDIALFAEEMIQQLKKDKVHGKKRDIIAERIPNIKGRMLQSYMKLLKLPKTMQDWNRCGYLTVKDGEKIANNMLPENEEIITKIEKEGRVVISKDITDEEKKKELAALINEAFKKNKGRPAQKRKSVKTEMNKIDNIINEMLQTEYFFPEKDVEKKLLERDIYSLIERLEKIAEKI